MNEPVSAELDLATDLAREAGSLLLQKFGRVTAVATKSTPTDLVSDADRESESLILERLLTERPDDGVLSEEGGREVSESGLTWIVDPLDGTVNYLFGLPMWAVSIAVVDERGPRTGVIVDPTRDELFAAQRDRGANLNGAPIRVSDREELSTALIGTGFAYDAESRKVQAKRMPAVLPDVRDIRRAGSAALDLAWVACGRLDGFFEAPMKVWDRSAGEILVREAGGVVSPLDPPFGDDRGVIAANAGLHPLLSALVSD